MVKSFFFNVGLYSFLLRTLVSINLKTVIDDLYSFIVLKSFIENHDTFLTYSYRVTINPSDNLNPRDEVQNRETEDARGVVVAITIT